MNGADSSRMNGEFRVSRFEQLPTPSLSPQPDDVASSSSERCNGEDKSVKLGIEVASVGGLDGSGSRSTSLSSQRQSINDEAILSDSSERARPVPKIKRPGDGRRRSSVSEQEKILKLSPKQIHELTGEPSSIPIRAATPIPEDMMEGDADTEEGDAKESKALGIPGDAIELNVERHNNDERRSISKILSVKQDNEIIVKSPFDSKHGRPALSSRAISTPALMRRKHSNQRNQGQAVDGEVEKRTGRHIPPPLNLDHKNNTAESSMKQPPQDRKRDTSPIPASIPLPPFSMPTFLSLELAPDRPSPLYIYRSSTTEFPYESSKIKYERLISFLFLPPILEKVLAFGAFACLDAWMHILTILPLRFLIAVGILVRWWGSVFIMEVHDLWSFVYSGLGRVWRRRRRTTDTPTPALSTPADETHPTQSRRRSVSATAVAPPSSTSVTKDYGKATFNNPVPELKEKQMRRSRSRHRRLKSAPSALLPSHKADILKGLLVITSCAVLMRFDASRMYHGIRGQAAIKLYVIYNVLEVCDRLLSAIGQDVLECLFSRETLDRKPNGRSKVIRPFWMFVLALVYNVAHAAALFYQVITLNVAVNSYSNALLTLLMSNQFVEIKGTVFKKFEKENLFQLTCSDIVERFQLCLMLLIIAMRNIVEVGGLSITNGGTTSSWTSGLGPGNSTSPLSASSIIPLSFTIFPKWIGQVLNPFLLVLGSEMLVDWLKHAYITKFNQTKPAVYDKFFDVLAKDYYSDAFSEPQLTRRLGLPTLPLSCLFIRAAIQTYHMFIATHMPLPFPSASTSVTEAFSPATSPSTTAALAHIDQLFRRALGRSSFGAGSIPNQAPWYNFLKWDLDDVIAFTAMVLVFLVLYLLLLAFKLVLGMIMLKIARNRFAGMKEREIMSVETGGKRLGGWGVVDVDEEKRKWIYSDDSKGLEKLKERDERDKRKEEREREEGTGFGHVSRYSMVAKRIW
ncbi:DUF747-domain-containing protein [Lojkania enalia]|uniref:DUF747-domain-containing protein n=1 Tax=Lojkania enalia TaxID=147567 RepID=A0A9P4K5Q3_9PLEO|nr:DUF747-domain-containing protein [Didymosphaeria enalia]